MFGVTKKIANAMRPLIKRIDDVRHTLTTRVDENKTRCDENVKRIQQMASIIDRLLVDNKKHKADLDLLLNIKRLKEGDTPWFDYTGAEVDPERGLRMKMDWNDAFIDQLRSQGYRGITESELVGQYLLEVSNVVATEGKASGEGDPEE